MIGLNLCPFAKAVYVKEQVHYAVNAAQDDDALLADLQVELGAWPRPTRQSWTPAC